MPRDLLNKYDLVLASGVFTDGEIPATGFEDAHALCKPGGYFISSQRSKYYVNGESHGFKDKLDELVAAGKFRVVKTWKYMRGIKNQPESIFAEQESTMFIY